MSKLPPKDVTMRGMSTSAADTNVPHLELHPVSVTNTSRWRSLELRLVYHYTAVVSHVMPQCIGVTTRTWRQTIPQMSFESEVVLNPMLALAALHLSAYSPDNTAMTMALGRYLDQTLVMHRQALSNGEAFSEQLWLSAVLISHIYWLVAHQRRPNETYELPVHAFKIVVGIGGLFTREKTFLSQLDYVWLGDEPAPDITADDKLSPAAKTRLRRIEADIISLFEAFDLPALPDEEKSIYAEVKDYVLYHYRAYYSGVAAESLRRFVGFMALRCQPGYRVMLERHDPLAMALMARMLVLLKGLEHAWWIQGEGDFEVVERDVRGICELMPPDLRWVMDWPCRVLDGEIMITRAGVYSPKGPKK